MRRTPSAIALVLASQALVCAGVGGSASAAEAPQDASGGGSAALSAGSTGGSTGGSSASASQSNALDDMARRLEALEKRNSQLQQEVVDLKAESGERWLTEERAAEIRGIVQDVLADAGERSSLQSSGMTAGWDDGFFLSSPDGRFRMNISGFSQARWVWSEMRQSLPTPPGGTRFPTNLTATGFDLPNTQLWIDGHILSPDVTYMVKARFGNETPTGFDIQAQGQPGGFVQYGDGGQLQLMDAWVRIALTDEWSFRAGQFRSPYSRDFLVLEQYQMAVARSVIAEHYSIGYTQGLELEYLSDEMRWRLSVNDGGNDYLFGPVQVVGSQPWNSPWDDQPAKWAVTSRFEWKGAGSWRQFDQFTSPEGTDPGWLFGIAFNLQGSNPTEIIPGGNLTGDLPNSSGQANDWFGVTADYTMLLGGASLYVAGYWNYISSHSASYLNGVPPVNYWDIGNTYAMGAQVQFAGYFAPKWEAFVRYEYGYANNSDPWIRPASGAGAGTIIQYTQGQSHLSIATVGVNWYIDGQDLKVSADFGYAFTPVDPAFATPQIGWRGSESDEFVMRAQIQLMF
ncbi:MAG: bZIP transcription factor [Phycisphaerales bacterium]|nr:bZIP transcription factor [Phycisphaerales bacterium]